MVGKIKIANSEVIFQENTWLKHFCGKSCQLSHSLNLTILAVCLAPWTVTIRQTKQLWFGALKTGAMSA